LPKVYAEHFQRLIHALDEACRSVYRDRLRSLAIFGSVARGVQRPDSDIDLLIVATGLPAGRLARVAEFDAVEGRLEPELAAAAGAGVHTRLSPVFKSPEEVEFGSPLFLDMTRDVLLLQDRENLLQNRLQRLGKRLEELGSKRIDSGSGYYWVLKPNYQPGDVIEL
jgi:uncharacterized protein